MSTPIGLFRTSKRASAEPEIVITSPIIDISTSFQILNKFSTIATPLVVFRISKITSAKSEVIITLILIDISTYFKACE